MTRNAKTLHKTNDGLDEWQRGPSLRFFHCCVSLGSAFAFSSSKLAASASSSLKRCLVWDFIQLCPGLACSGLPKSPPRPPSSHGPLHAQRKVLGKSWEGPDGSAEVGRGTHAHLSRAVGGACLDAVLTRSQGSGAGPRVASGSGRRGYLTQRDTPGPG